MALDEFVSFKKPCTDYTGPTAFGRENPGIAFQLRLECLIQNWPGRWCSHSSPSHFEIHIAESILKSDFRMAELGPRTYYLGMAITRNRSQKLLQLNQPAYLPISIPYWRRMGCENANMWLYPWAVICK